MQTHHLQPGDWYHSIDCSRCGATVHAFHARSGDGERLPGPGLFSVRCSECGYPDLYKPNAFKTRQYTQERTHERRLVALESQARCAVSSLRPVERI